MTNDSYSPCVKVTFPPTWLRKGQNTTEMTPFHYLGQHEMYHRGTPQPSAGDGIMVQNGPLHSSLQQALGEAKK